MESHCPKVKSVDLFILFYSWSFNPDSLIRYVEFLFPFLSFLSFFALPFFTIFYLISYHLSYFYSSPFYRPHSIVPDRLFLPWCTYVHQQLLLKRKIKIVKPLIVIIIFLNFYFFLFDLFFNDIFNFILFKIILTSNQKLPWYIQGGHINVLKKIFNFDNFEIIFVVIHHDAE